MIGYLLLVRSDNLINPRDIRSDQRELGVKSDVVERVVPLLLQRSHDLFNGLGVCLVLRLVGGASPLEISLQVPVDRCVGGKSIQVGLRSIDGVTETTNQDVDSFLELL